MTRGTAKISFVIPTFNFAEFLPDTLDSILREEWTQIEVEIIVFDGGSSDNTLEILERYKLICPNLIIIVATERGSIDIDLNKAVAAATCEYIWTLSSDDVLMPGWLRVMLEYLEGSAPDLVLIPAVHCDIKMQPRRNYQILRETRNGPLIKVIEDDDDLLFYLNSVRTSEGLFSFCSACVVRRNRLLQAPQLEQANGTCWRYAVRLIAVLTSYPSAITVLDLPLIKKRGDNDSFANSGVIQRLKIATLNWDKAIESLGLNTKITHAMLDVVKSDIRPLTLLYLSQFVRSLDERATFGSCVETRISGHGIWDRFLSVTLKKTPPLAPLRSAMKIAKAGMRIVQQQLWSARLPK